MKVYTLDDAARLVITGQCINIKTACQLIMTWCKHGKNKASIGVMITARN